MTTQVIAASNSKSTASQPIPSTKVRVSTDSITVYYAVGTNPVANSGNCEIIPADSVRYINMNGTNNQIAFITEGGSGNVSVTAIGTVSSRAIY